MTPLRRKVNYLLVPAYLVVAALTLAVMIVAGTQEIWWLFAVCGGVFAVSSAACLTLGLLTAKKERQAELAHWSFLWEDPAPFEGERLNTVDEETGIAFTVDKSGLTVRYPNAGEQVFEEADEGTEFFAWDDLGLMIATDNFARRIRIAIAAADIRLQSVDAEAEPMEDTLFFLPLDRELFSAMHAFGLEEKLPIELLYIKYNPKDAIVQILDYGHIKVMRNKKTGKVFVDEEGEFLG